MQEPLPTVAGAYLLIHQTTINQPSEDSSQTLFGNVQRSQQVTHCYAAVRTNKIQRTVVGATQVVFLENPISNIGEVSISEEHQFDGFARRCI